MPPVRHRFLHAGLSSRTRSRPAVTTSRYYVGNGESPHETVSFYGAVGILVAVVVIVLLVQWENPAAIFLRNLCLFLALLFIVRAPASADVALFRFSSNPGHGSITPGQFIFLNLHSEKEEKAGYRSRRRLHAENKIEKRAEKKRRSTSAVDVDGVRALTGSQPLRLLSFNREIPAGNETGLGLP